MKLNATAEMMPVTWPEWGRLHPFAPASQAEGYRAIFTDLERMLCARSPASPAMSLQPNAGSQGEYAGLLVIRAFHESRGQGHRDVCLIPSSAHGTNPASRGDGRATGSWSSPATTAATSTSTISPPRPREHADRWPR